MESIDIKLESQFIETKVTKLDWTYTREDDVECMISLDGWRWMCEQYKNDNLIQKFKKKRLHKGYLNRYIKVH